MREMVLLINFQDKKKLRDIKSILMTKKILGRQVALKDYSQPIGALTGIKEMSLTDTVYNGEELEKEMMIFAGLPESKLDYVLQTMRKKGIPRVDYKAVLTPVNVTWTIPELYSELAKEHEQFTNTP